MEENSSQRTGNAVVIFALMGLVLVIMSVAGYALFVLKNMTGIHITTSDINQEEKQQIQENISWEKYNNQNYGFNVSYPASWKVREGGDSLVSFRKLNEKTMGQIEISSLEMIVQISIIDDVKNDLKQSLEESGKLFSEDNSVIKVGIEEIIKTGKIKAPEGLQVEAVYWKRDDKIFCVEGAYYISKTKELEDIFRKIVRSLEFF